MSARRLAHAGLAALLLAVLPLVLSPLVASCRASAPYDGPTAECPVCKHEGDLACLCVHVEPDTPNCECNGQKYYFCSDQCRADFLAHPERYTK